MQYDGIWTCIESCSMVPYLIQSRLSRLIITVSVPGHPADGEVTATASHPGSSGRRFRSLRSLKRAYCILSWVALYKIGKYAHIPSMRPRSNATQQN